MSHSDEMIRELFWLRRLAARLVGPGADAEDLTQETLRVALERDRRREADVAGSRLRPWLTGIARRLALVGWRDDARRRWREADAAAREALPSAADAVANAEARKRLVEAVLGLNEPLRAAVALRYLEGLSYGDVAQQLGLNEAAARQRVSRGLAALRLQLGTAANEAGGGPGPAWLLALGGAMTVPCESTAPTAALLAVVLMQAKTKLILGVSLAVLTGGIVGWGALLPSDPAPTPAPEAFAAVDDLAQAPLPASQEANAASMRVPVPAEEEAAPEAAPVELPTSGVLEVTVTTSAGVPAFDALVSVRDSDADPMLRLQPITARTDHQGKARINGIPWSKAFATAVTDGFSETASEPVNLSPSEPFGSVRIQLTTGGCVEGDLFDVDGFPAVGVRLGIYLKGWPHQQDRRSSGFAKYTATAQEGSFRFDLLPAGRYRLRTYAKGDDLTRVPGQMVDLEVKEGQTTRVAFDDLRASHVRVTGQILLNDAPLALARISVHHEEFGRGHLGRQTKTDEDGVFELIVDEPGDYRFQVFSRSALGGSAFHVESIPQARSHDMVIRWNIGAIAGHVYDSEGQPAAGVPLKAFGELEGGGGSTYFRAVTDANGAFEFRTVLAGTYKVLAGPSASMTGDHEDFSAHPYLGGAEVYDLGVDAGNPIVDLDLHLRAASALAGVVVDSSGSPVDSARVECWPGEPDPLLLPRGMGHLRAPRVQSGADGGFLVGGLQPGPYRVRAIVGARISPWTTLDLASFTTAKIELVVGEGALVIVQVHGLDEPERGFVVGIRDDSGLTVTSAMSRDGEAALGPLLPGDYQVYADGGDGVPEVAQRVAVGDRAEQMVALSNQ